HVTGVQTWALPIWSAEHVTDEPRVARPVHAELELEHDPRDDAHGEVDQEELAPELGRPEPLVVARAEPGRLHGCDEGGETDGQRDEEEVIDRRNAELPARKIKCFHSGPPIIAGSRVGYRPVT